jgi:hypothetical protein
MTPKLLPITEENTQYFVTEKGYTRHQCANLILSRRNRRIYGINGFYYIAEVDELDRNLFEPVPIIE